MVSRRGSKGTEEPQPKRKWISRPGPDAQQKVLSCFYRMRHIKNIVIYCHCGCVRNSNWKEQI